jgi:hypothetical protein
LTAGGKTRDPDHSQPDNIDHQKPELNAFYIVIYVNYSRVLGMTGQMWSICPAFALTLKMSWFLRDRQDNLPIYTPSMVFDFGLFLLYYLVKVIRGINEGFAWWTY